MYVRRYVVHAYIGAYILVMYLRSVCLWLCLWLDWCSEREITIVCACPLPIVQDPSLFANVHMLMLRGLHMLCDACALRHGV